MFDSGCAAERLHINFRAFNDPASRAPSHHTSSWLAAGSPSLAAHLKGNPTRFARVSDKALFVLLCPAGWAAWVEEQDAPTGKYTSVMNKYVVEPGSFASCPGLSHNCQWMRDSRTKEPLRCYRGGSVSTRVISYSVNTGHLYPLP